MHLNGGVLALSRYVSLDEGDSPATPFTVLRPPAVPTTLGPVTAASDFLLSPSRLTVGCHWK